jgi:hypothetical protein
VSDRVDAVRPWDDRCHCLAQQIEERNVAREPGGTSADAQIPLFADCARSLCAKDFDTVMRRAA